ncbi:hypothetical protein Hanom_Chr09g00766531 [Helianthus anomalus]
MYAVCMYTYTVNCCTYAKTEAESILSTIYLLLMTNYSSRIDKTETEQLLAYQSVDKINTKRRRFALRF